MKVSTAYVGDQDLRVYATADGFVNATHPEMAAFLLAHAADDGWLDDELETEDAWFGRRGRWVVTMDECGFVDAWKYSTEAEADRYMFGFRGLTAHR